MTAELSLALVNRLNNVGTIILRLPTNINDWPMAFVSNGLIVNWWNQTTRGRYLGLNRKRIASSRTEVHHGQSGQPTENFSW
jgi:hypothetical protein